WLMYARERCWISLGSMSVHSSGVISWKVASRISAPQFFDHVAKQGNRIHAPGNLDNKGRLRQHQDFGRRGCPCPRSLGHSLHDNRHAFLAGTQTTHRKSKGHASPCERDDESNQAEGGDGRGHAAALASFFVALSFFVSFSFSGLTSSREER